MEKTEMEHFCGATFYGISNGTPLVIEIHYAMNKCALGERKQIMQLKMKEN